MYYDILLINKMATWRERQAKKAVEEKNKNLELNEINFPSLSTSGWDDGSKTGVAKKHTKSFASLAKEWNEHAEKAKIQVDAEEEQRRIEEYEREQIRKRRGASNYNFGTSHAREEDTYYESTEDDYIPEPNANTSEDWRTISKKTRKPRSKFDSAVFEPPPPIQEEETAWDHDYE